MMTNAFSMPFQGFNADAFSKMFAMPDSMGSAARETMAASTQSVRASAKGLQDAGSVVMRQLKDHAEMSTEMGKKLADAGSIQDAMQIHAGYVKSSVEANMKGFTELSTLYADTLREAFAPLAKQAKKASKSA